MALAIPTISQIITQIKKEARIEGSDNLDSLILSLLNELLVQETNNHRYGEMLVVNHALTLVDAQESYPLPADFANSRLIRYKYTTSGYTITLNPRTEYVKERLNGAPKFYDIAAGQLLIFPYQQVLATDQLLLDYYKFPDELVADNTAFPIIRLIGSFKQQIIARMHVYSKDFNAAQFHTGEGSASTRQVQLESQ